MTTNDNGTLVIYMCAADQDWILLPSGDDTQDSYTRVIQESYSWSPGEAVRLGERLTKHEIVSSTERRVIPAEWVVTEIEHYDTATETAAFGRVAIAYCERQPLSEAEVEQQSYTVDVQAPALV
jgi:hypothetical protein